MPFHPPPCPDYPLPKSLLAAFRVIVTEHGLAADCPERACVRAGRCASRKPRLSQQSCWRRIWSECSRVRYRGEIAAAEAKEIDEARRIDEMRVRIARALGYDLRKIEAEQAAGGAGRDAVDAAQVNPPGDQLEAPPRARPAAPEPPPADPLALLRRDGPRRTGLSAPAPPDALGESVRRLR